MPPGPPQRGTAFVHSKYAPVTLYYSPATTILNENPGIDIENIIKLFILLFFVTELFSLCFALCDGDTKTINALTMDKKQLECIKILTNDASLKFSKTKSIIIL